MSELKMFIVNIRDKKSEAYERLNDNINEYAKEKDLYVESIHYDRLSDVIIANVLFSNIPKGMFVL